MLGHGTKCPVRVRSRHYHDNSAGGGSPGRQQWAQPPAVRHITCLIDWTNVGYSAAREPEWNAGVHAVGVAYNHPVTGLNPSPAANWNTTHSLLTLIGFSPGVYGHYQELRKWECWTKEAPSKSAFESSTKHQREKKTSEFCWQMVM